MNQNLLAATHTHTHTPLSNSIALQWRVAETDCQKSNPNFVTY